MQSDFNFFFKKIRLYDKSLIEFTPNWVLFLICYLKIIGDCNLDLITLWCGIALLMILCPIGPAASYFLGSHNLRFNIPPNLPRALRKGAVSSCDFFLSSSSFSFSQICFFFHMLDRISTKLGQNDQWVSGYKSYALFDLKGHVRVTRVKKVIFTENASPPTCFIGFWRNLVRSISG